jgi:hypothetical protein
MTVMQKMHHHTEYSAQYQSGSVWYEASAGLFICFPQMVWQAD